MGTEVEAGPAGDHGVPRLGDETVELVASAAKALMLISSERADSHEAGRGRSGWFVRDLETAVDLHRVGRDDVRPEPVGYGLRDGALAGRGRAEDHDHLDGPRRARVRLHRRRCGNVALGGSGHAQPPRGKT